MSNRKSVSETISNKCLGMDRFGTRFNFRMPDGRAKHKTFIGVVMSLLLIVILLTFIVYRLDDMR